MASLLGNTGIAVSVAVAVVLALGLYNLTRSQSSNRSQLLMRWRVGLQFAAIVLVVASAWLVRV